MKYRYYLLLASVFLLLGIIFLPTNPPRKTQNEIIIQLEKHKEDFKLAKYAIIIDYSKPIYKKRLWIIEITTEKVVGNYHVSHALKSGLFYATKFSNEVGSKLSCKGTFKTSNIYESKYGKGKYKIGMRITGLDENINDHAFERNIVFHSSYGFWSSGCFMTPPKINKKIIDLTKDGSLLIVF